MYIKGIFDSLIGSETNPYSVGSSGMIPLTDDSVRPVAYYKK